MAKACDEFKILDLIYKDINSIDGTDEKNISEADGFLNDEGTMNTITSPEAMDEAI